MKDESDQPVTVSGATAKYADAEDSPAFNLNGSTLSAELLHVGELEVTVQGDAGVVAQPFKVSVLPTSNASMPLSLIGVKESLGSLSGTERFIFTPARAVNGHIHGFDGASSIYVQASSGRNLDLVDKDGKPLLGPDNQFTGVPQHGGIYELTLPSAALRNGSAELYVQDRWYRDVSRKRLFVYSQQNINAGPAPRIEEFAPVKDHGFKAIDSKPVPVDGRTLALSGFASSEARSAPLLIFHKLDTATDLPFLSGNVFGVLTAKELSRADRKWTHESQLPVFPVSANDPIPFIVVAKSVFDGGHRYSQPVLVTQKTTQIEGVSLGQPAIKDANPAGSRYITTRTATLTVTAPQAQANDLIVVTRAGTIVGSVELTTNPAQNPVEIPLKNLQSGDNRLSVVLLRGDA
ncbi:MAG: hypothetical protein KDA85_18245, partial [Planctomycetaceae bacterium]|nr:hypothetical protein [Planctomycetaceae bacterium]